MLRYLQKPRVLVINVGCLKIHSVNLLNIFTFRQHISNVDLYFKKKANNVFLHDRHLFLVNLIPCWFLVQMLPLYVGWQLRTKLTTATTESKLCFPCPKRKKRYNKPHAFTYEGDVCLILEKSCRIVFQQRFLMLKVGIVGITSISSVMFKIQSANKTPVTETLSPVWN